MRDSLGHGYKYKISREKEALEQNVQVGEVEIFGRGAIRERK